MAAHNKTRNLWMIAIFAIGAFLGFPNLAWASGYYYCNSPAYLVNDSYCSDSSTPLYYEYHEEPTCTSPQILSNGVCVTPTPTCTYPQVLQGDVCVTPTPTCTYPQVLQGDVCVTPTPTCIDPQVLQGDVCVTPTPTCTYPQVLQGDVCVTPTPTCTYPQVLQGDVCVTPLPTCTAPQVLQGDVCVTPLPTCIAPQVLQGDVCVTPTPVCTSPQVLLDNVCITPSEAQVMQPSTLIASGSFIEPNDTPEEATPILINDVPLFQFLPSLTDEDWFEIYLNAGQRYTIDIPAASIGKMINPALQLYDAAGNLTASDNGASGQGRQIIWTATTSGLFRIRVTGQALPAKKSSAVELKGEAVDYSYQVRVFLTDAPQQVLTKGRVLDNCGQGVNEAKISALRGSVLSSSALTNKIGEFGLLLNSGNYTLKILATNFQEASKSVVVDQESTVLDEIKLSPKTTTSCVSNLAVQAQQAPAVYEDQLGLLIIKDIVIDDKVYYVELKNIGDYRFQLTQFFAIPGVIHSDPPEYVPGTLTAKLPKVFALDQIWNIQLRHNGTGVLTLESAQTY